MGPVTMSLQDSGITHEGDAVARSLPDQDLEIVRLPMRTMERLVVDLLEPIAANAADRGDEVLSRLAALLSRLFVARHAFLLRWEPARHCYSVWQSTTGVLHDTAATIPAEAEPLPLVTAQGFGLSVARPAKSRHLDSSLRTLLGSRPALLLPLADHQMVTGVLVLELTHTLHDGEMALALAVARRAIAVIAGAPGSGKTGRAGQRPPRVPRVQGHSTPSATELTPRELEVLGLLARGFRNKEIAAALGIGEKTVKFHVGHIFDKLDVDSRTELVLRVLGRHEPTGQPGLGLAPSHDSCSTPP